MGHHFIANTWVEGQGTHFISKNPADDTTVWEGVSASKTQIDAAVQAAQQAFPSWARLSFDERLELLTRFQQSLESKRQELTLILAKEVGKPLWEADTEIGGMINKLPISVEAFRDRCPERTIKVNIGTLKLKHKPHGVVAVLGPFNFPAHVPNGHIIPALLAGNTVIFKPSELTPWVSENIMHCWKEAKLPPGVINLVQGAGDVGKYLAENPLLNGLFFTGSSKTGQSLLRQFSTSPEKILALELGGNNPLVVHNVGNEIDAAVYLTLQSAYLTTGQRCTCARRLIVTRNKEGERFVAKLITAINKIKVGPYSVEPQPFMGPLVSKEAMQHVFSAYEKLIDEGADPLVPVKKLGAIGAFLSPGLLDVSNIKSRRDEEIFGPVLQLLWVNDFDEAIQEANKTEYGLVAGLLSENEKHFQRFYDEVRAGLINWNRPLTGASSQAPFGGIGKSGNHRPSAYYAADYCAYPVPSLCDKGLDLPAQLTPGIVIK